MATEPDDTPTTSGSSQEILGRFVDEWLQVLGKDEIKSIAMFWCFHLITLFAIWNGKRWKLYATACDGTKIPKGMKMVLEEHGVSTAGKKADWMRETLVKHSYFRDEKSAC